MRYTTLGFDSKIFKFKVAKILPPKLSFKELRSILVELKNQNIRLVYWASDSTDKASQQAVKKLRGFLASKQITYLTKLKKNQRFPVSTSEVKIYKAKLPAASLKKLALAAGTYSRFKLDPKLPNRYFHELYYKWIKNSVNRSIADRVIITRHHNKITAMATLGIKNKRGDIGLLAVDKNFRGQKLGSKLVYAAQKYFTQKGFSKMQVVTQKANVAACLLYEKCGFHQEKVENFYHFWL